jgi:hypothetical protein
VGRLGAELAEAIGLNYEDHAAETGAEIPEKPVVFAKYPNTIIGPGEPIRIPPIAEQIDYEAELAVVIGGRAKGVPEAEALEYVFGYTNSNDVSARDLQFSEGVAYGADMRLFVRFGEMPCVMYGAGDVNVAHAPDEHVSITELLTATKTIACLLADWCG